MGTRAFPDQSRCAACGKAAAGFLTFRGLRLGTDHTECRMRVARQVPGRTAGFDLEVRTVPFSDLQIRSVDNGAGAFEGYANLFKVRDTYETRFMNAAWSKGGLDSEPYPLLWMHSPYDPIGVLNASEDSKGLGVEGRWDNTDEGKRARDRAESSAPELSVGFKTKQRSKDDPRDVVAAELREVSQVTARWGSTPGARLVGVRMATGTSTRAVEGSYEDAQEDLREAIQAQFGGGAPWGCYVVATFPDRVIYINGGDMDDDDAYQVTYTVGDDGSITFGQPEPVEISQVVQPRAKEVDQVQLQLLERRRMAAKLGLEVRVVGTKEAPQT